MKSPRITATLVDWDAIAVEFGALDPQGPMAPNRMAELSRATGERFANIAASPVPVLLPFDTAAFLHDRAIGSDGIAVTSPPADNYLFGFNAVPFFYPGPAGYDAVVIARAQDMPELQISFSDPIYIHVGGSALLYEVDEPTGMIGWPVHGLDEFPGIRRMFLETYARYTFVRYGVRSYRCRVNGQKLILDESAADNYSYPWRGNFCETRNFYVGQCPAGLGHQGQDIRPASCKQRIEGANRCEPYLHDVVAVRDGAVLRAQSQEALFIVTNGPNERIRFRYLHMLPKQFNADGMVSGRLVRQGEIIGKVGNFFRRERGTTYHLHFDLQVPTKYCWVFVNPYMTLVAAYERQIHGRGQEIKEQEDVPTASIPMRPLAIDPDAAAKPTETAIESSAGNATESKARPDERADEPSPIKAKLPRRAGGGHGGLERNGTRAGKQIAVRPVGRSLSRTGARAWYIRRYIHAGYGQYQTGYSSF